MSAYLTGASFLCAQGENAAAWANLASPKAPASYTARILEDAITLPCFRAFPDAPMPLDALYPRLEQHIAQCAADAGWSAETLATTPIFLGSTVYVIADREHRAAQNTLTPSYDLTEIARHLRQKTGSPAVYTFATSCTASAHGIAAAARQIGNGFIDRALVLGFESANRMTIDHFQALGLAASEHRPLADAGIIPGEGIACLALENTPRNGAPRLHAFTAHTDHANLTQTSAAAVRHLITATLANARLDASDIRAVKLHGAGTSDAMERAILDDLLPGVPHLPCKAWTGHTLGATAALETALIRLCLARGTFPLPGYAQTLAPGHYLHYFLGFGGSHMGWVLTWE
ncbi:MAG: beta-ketoacyl synthase N-terminal-like domain-containing protein [Cardiobacteriaceae bacterium]|nr:beta-ketoacyl synthase N-terminal-like domain-containing protein [Cardiobacteriaceae bacterium]